MGLIFALSAQPSSSFPEDPLASLPISLEAIAHLGLYGVLGLLAGVGAAPRRRRAWAWLFLACAAYGLSDEAHQLLVPGRAFQMTDLLLDGAGSLAGLALAGRGYGGLWGTRREREPRRSPRPGPRHGLGP